MQDKKRRLPLMVGLALVAMAVVFPASASAAERHHRTIPADVLGAHAWSGQLCDGTAVAVNFHVTDRGRLVFDSATGAPARVHGQRDWFRVRFIGTSTRMFAWTAWRHGVLHLHVGSRQGDCPPAADPPPTGDPAPPDDGGNGQSG